MINLDYTNHLVNERWPDYGSPASDDRRMLVIIMTPGNYQSIFEIGLGSFPWARVAHPLIAFAIGLLLLCFSRSNKIFLVMGLFGVSFGTLLSVISLITFVPVFINDRKVYVSGKSLVVEGVVEDFRQAPALGPARESFSVRGVNFSYNVLDDTPCFHDAPLHGGPIRDGLDVRIHYTNGCIQRVDVREPVLSHRN